MDGEMKFIDEAIIEVIAGDGGKGCVGFRKEKYVPRGGPNGGDGGNGGSIIITADRNIATLMDVHYRRNFKAGHGEHGMGKQMYGRAAEDIYIRVPVGTTIADAETGEMLADMDESGIDWVAAKGGRGGRGNMHFVSSTHQAPREFEEGGKGEYRKLRLELKLLADVGLVGFPNAGKSTLISSVSNARPKIADYPFTTKVPGLGLVRLDENASFVMADIPGLIEGAHEGSGMGIQFLRHIERTKVIVHLVDITDPARPDACESYKAIRAELGAYSEEMLSKPEIVVLTKMDMTEAKEMRDEVISSLKKAGASDVIAISAAAHDGLDELLRRISAALNFDATTIRHRVGS